MSDRIKLLIEQGADVHTHGPAALELAIANGYDAKVRALMGEVVDIVDETLYAAGEDEN
jgi:hypothetical protein